MSSSPHPAANTPLPPPSPPPKPPGHDQMVVDPVAPPSEGQDSSPFAATGPALPGVPVDGTFNVPALVRLPNVVPPHWTFQQADGVIVHSHGCPPCDAYLRHLAEARDSIDLTEARHSQSRFHSYQFDMGVERGLAYASTSIEEARADTRAHERTLARVRRERSSAQDAQARIEATLTTTQRALEDAQARILSLEEANADLLHQNEMVANSLTATQRSLSSVTEELEDFEAGYEVAS
ncbi:hypothetical protein BV25DRAFT_1922807, partial [Artomyces pyxidatus]